MKDNHAEGVRAVGRALEILQAFTINDRAITASELLQRVALSRPTLYRLLNTLIQSGFVVSEGEPQKFRLGPAVGQLAHVWTSSLNMAALGQPMMQRLWASSGETVALFVPQGPMRLCIAELVSPQALSFKRGVGYQERIVLGASGKAILANCDLDVQTLAQYASGLTIDPVRFIRELQQIQKRGYAISRNALIQGAVAVAAPFFNGSGQVAGSIAVFGPAVRLKEARVRQMGSELIQEAELLSQALGRK